MRAGVSVGAWCPSVAGCSRTAPTAEPCLWRPVGAVREPPVLSLEAPPHQIIFALMLDQLGKAAMNEVAEERSAEVERNVIKRGSPLRHEHLLTLIQHRITGADRQGQQAAPAHPAAYQQ